MVDAIVIGTGFGASVAATHLLAKGKKVLMLERGLWWYTPERPLPPYIVPRSQGKFPEQPIQYWPRPNHAAGLLDLFAVVKTNSPLEEARTLYDRFKQFFDQKLEPQPLYRYNLFEDVHILAASGVGGGSLVYSNISIEPIRDPATKTHPVMNDWPIQLDDTDYRNARDWMATYRGTPNQVVTRAPITRELLAQLNTDLNRNDITLSNLPAPYDLLYLRRSNALKVAAEKLGMKWDPLDLQIEEFKQLQDAQGKPGVDPAKPFCERQGRCFMGCLPGARHTLNKTLVNLLSTNQSLQLKSLVNVDRITKNPAGGYDVHYTDARNDKRGVETAPEVVVAAGVLGTNQIMLKSADDLNLGPMVGHRFSTNGDSFGFVTVLDTNPLWPLYATRGPINTSHVQVQRNGLYMTIEDAAIPPMFAGIAKRALEILQNAGDQNVFIKALEGLFTRHSLKDLTQFISPDPSDPAEFQTEDEMGANIFFFNCMGTDKGNGQFKLRGDRLDLTYPAGDKPGDNPVFQTIVDVMKEMSQAMGGTFIPSPVWEGFAKKKLVTVHPLGGCVIGKDLSEGAVDLRGRPFNKKTGGVHDGLYVMDASVMPGPLAVNPTLSIVAMAKKLANTNWQ